MTPETGRPAPTERGSVTALLAVVLGVAVVVATAALTGASARTASVRAQHAADAAAVGAAAALVGLAPGEPCGVAARLTAVVGADLATCETAAATVRTRAVVGAGPFSVGADAVAGPADDPSEHYVYGVPVGPRSSVPRSTRATNDIGGLVVQGRRAPSIKETRARHEEARDRREPREGEDDRAIPR